MLIDSRAMALFGNGNGNLYERSVHCHIEQSFHCYLQSCLSVRHSMCTELSPNGPWNPLPSQFFTLGLHEGALHAGVWGSGQGGGEWLSWTGGL